MTSEDIQTKLKTEPTQKIKSGKPDSEACVQDSEKTRELKKLYDRLWEAADELRANSKLRSSQYSTPVLGILFLRYAYHKFEEATKKLKKKYSGRNRPIRKLDYQVEGAIFLTEKAHYKYLLELPEGASIGKAIDDAMRNIEDENEELRDVLPKVYTNMEDSVLINLLKIFHKIPTGLDRDIFGKIYEYFLGEFAKKEGQRGGEFYTPTSIVRLIVEVLEPYYGIILDPACGSGGMFVQSAEFVKDHLKKPFKEISIYGQEKADDTVRLCKMNLAIHGLSGDVKQGNTYYEDVFNMREKFDFVMANPPFNVNNVDKEAVKDDPRYPFGLPTGDNANYLWIQLFYSMLNDGGQAGFVMANSASDIRGSEREIRKKIIESKVIDTVISIGTKFFYTVTGACTLWFFNKKKIDSERKNKILFIDARSIYKQIDRAHREFTFQQIEFISNIVRLYQRKKISTKNCSTELLQETFPERLYLDVKGLCKVVDIEEIRKQNYSLNPGRYVGTKEKSGFNVDFENKLSELTEEMKILIDKSNGIENEVLDNIDELLETYNKHETVLEQKKINDILERTPRAKKIKKSSYLQRGPIPIIDQGIEFVSGYTDDLETTYNGQLPVVVFGDHTRILKYVPFNFAQGADGTKVLRCNEDFDIRYFYYCLKNVKLKSYGYSRHFKFLKEKKIPYRPLNVQKNIAGFLSNYDDLIINHNKQIEIIDEICQLLYNEWFVKFNFSSNKDREFIVSKMGPIPINWDIIKVKKLVKRLKHGREYRENNVIPFGLVPVVDQSRKLFLGFHNNVTDHFATFEEPIIIFGDHTCKMQLMIHPFSLGPNVVPFISKRDLSTYFLFFHLRNLVKTMDYRRHWNQLTEKEVLLPPKKLSKKFSKFVAPFFKKIYNLHKKNINLQQTLELLIPILVSGGIAATEVPTKN